MQVKSIAECILQYFRRYRVMAMLATLPYNSFKSYCASKYIYLINLVYRHADCLKITLSNAANRQYVLKQPKLIKLQLYAILTFKYTSI